MRRAKVVGIVVALVVTAYAALDGQAPEGTLKPSPVPRPVASVMEIMHALTIPASDGLFKAAGDPPTTETGWQELHLQTLVLAESGNLLMVGSRARDQREWPKAARRLVDAAAGAANAAAGRNADALAAASDAVYETCETCHSTYLGK